MYSSVKYCVKLANGYTNPIPSEKGLKQGCVLSPMLFNLFIDDIGNIFDKTCSPVSLVDIELNHLLYADDFILLSTSSESLQNCLNAIGTYSQRWDLTDGICARELAAAGEGLMRGLYGIYSISIATCKFPDSWKLGKVITVLKKGVSSNRENYRSLTMLNLTSKTLQNIARTVPQ